MAAETPILPERYSTLDPTKWVTGVPYAGYLIAQREALVAKGEKQVPLATSPILVTRMDVGATRDSICRDACFKGRHI